MPDGHVGASAVIPCVVGDEGEHGVGNRDATVLAGCHGLHR